MVACGKEVVCRGNEVNLWLTHWCDQLSLTITSKTQQRGCAWGARNDMDNSTEWVYDIADRVTALEVAGNKMALPAVAGGGGKGGLEPGKPFVASSYSSRTLVIKNRVKQRHKMPLRYWA